MENNLSKIWLAFWLPLVPSVPVAWSSWLTVTVQHSFKEQVIVSQLLNSKLFSLHKGSDHVGYSIVIYSKPFNPGGPIPFLAFGTAFENAVGVQGISSREHTKAWAAVNKVSGYAYPWVRSGPMGFDRACWSAIWLKVSVPLTFRFAARYS